MYYLTWETQKASIVLRKGVDEMGRALTNNILNLYHSRF
jgi:hypothetical protein